MVDFDVHGLAGVRVLGDAGDERVIQRQLGPLQRDLEREPDIVVEFVDELATGSLTLLGRDEWAFDSEGLIVLRGRHKSMIKVRLPLDTIGQGCHIVVQRGASAVPFLVQLVNLCVLANGGLPLHAAAFEADGVGVVVTGWSKGGKTESLLAALDDGARYVGDEWVHLFDGGSQAIGVPEPVRVWDWYVDQLHSIRVPLGAGGEARRRALGGAAALARRGERVEHTAMARLARRVHHLIDTQRHADVPVDQLIGPLDRVQSMRVDAVVHTMSVEGSGEVALAGADGADIAARMAGSLSFERLPLMALYHAFRYAFPQRSSALIERADEIERERLVQFIAPRTSYLCTHPYPPDLDALREVMRKVWER